MFWPLLALLIAASTTLVVTPVFVTWQLWLLLLSLVSASLTLAAIPVFVFTPYKPQTAATIEWSYKLRRFSPPAVMTALVLSFIICATLWGGSLWWSRLVMLLLLALLVAAIWFSRQHYFEWFFHPLPKATYAPASEAAFVSDSDMVIAVEINGDAVAYPVRHIAYHHIVQGQVDGRPITATY